MAGQTVSQINALFADNSTGAISAADLREFVSAALGEWAQIYVHDGAAAQAGVTTTPVLLTGFATDGPEDVVGADVANDRITLTTAGTYMVLFQLSFSGTAGTTFQFHGRLDGVEKPALACQTVLDAAGAVQSVSFVGLVAATAGQQLTVYVESDSGGGASLTPVHGQLVARRVQ